MRPFMTNALYSRGIVALTAWLTVRYLRQMATGQPARVRGWVCQSRPPLFRLAAEIAQADGMVARAEGEFMIGKGY